MQELKVRRDGAQMVLKITWANAQGDFGPRLRDINEPRMAAEYDFYVERHRRQAKSCMILCNFTTIMRKLLHVHISLITAWQGLNKWLITVRQPAAIMQSPM